jgi:hypothetical protein
LSMLACARCAMACGLPDTRTAAVVVDVGVGRE